MKTSKVFMIIFLFLLSGFAGLFAQNNEGEISQSNFVTSSLSNVGEQKKNFL